MKTEKGTKINHKNQNIKRFPKIVFAYFTKFHSEWENFNKSPRNLHLSKA
jgi:hypothetical protein